MRRHAHVARGGHDRPGRCLLPGLEVGGEDRDVVAAPWHEGARRLHGDHGVVDVQCAPLGGQGGTQPLFASERVCGGAGGQVHLACPALADELADLVDHGSGAQQQPTAAGPQRGVEVGQAIGKEGAAVGCGEAGIGNALVQDEERHDFRGGSDSGGQHRVVMQAQVGGEQADGGRSGDRHGLAPRRGRA